MDRLAVTAAIIQAGNSYAWFEQQSDPTLVKAAQACAVPVRFDRPLAMTLLQSPVLGLNGNSEAIFHKIIRLPFVHRGPDDSHEFAPSARRYFDESLRNNGVDYAKLNGIIADYLAGERRVLVVNGVPEDSHQVRELKLREVYHTIPADSERGREKLDEFLSSSIGNDVLPDNWAAFRICEYQRRYLPEWQLDAWYCEGRYHYFARDYSKAIPPLEKVRQSGQISEIVANAAHFLGVIYRDRRNLPQAVEVLEEAWDILEELNDRSGKAMVLNTLGGVYQDQRRLDEAAAALDESTRIRRKLGNQEDLAISLNTLGGVYKDQRRLDEAAKALEDARDIFEAQEDWGSKAMVLNSLGGVYKDRRRLPEAAQVLEVARDIWEDLNDPAQKAMVLNSLGGVYKDQRRLPEAAQVLEEGRDIWEDLNDPAQRAMTLNSLGGVYKDQRRLPEAAQVLEESVKIRRKLELWEDMAFSLNTLGGIYKDLGMFGEAETTLSESVKICTQFNDQRSLAMACNLFGQLYAKMQEWEKAREAYLRSAQVDESRGDHRNARKMRDRVLEMEEKLQKP